MTIRLLSTYTNSPVTGPAEMTIGLQLDLSHGLCDLLHQAVPNNNVGRTIVIQTGACAQVRLILSIR